MTRTPTPSPPPVTGPAPAPALAPAAPPGDVLVGSWAAGDAGRPGGPPWLPPRVTRRRIDLRWVSVASVMFLSELVFFGWRAAVEVGTTVGMTLASFALVGLLIRLVRKRAPVDGPLHALGAALLLGVCLPVSSTATAGTLAGVALGVLLHLVGRAHRLRAHPVVLALLIAWLLPLLLAYPRVAVVQPIPRPQSGPVLRPPRALVGDVHDYVGSVVTQPWWETAGGPPHDAVLRYDPGVIVLRERQRMLEHPPLLVDMLVSGDICRVEELLLGSVPGSVGATGTALLVLLGLYLMYHRLSWWPAAVTAVGGALTALLVMPVHSAHPLTVVAVRLGHLPLAVGVSYLGYMLLATPLLLVALILGPMTAPTSAWGRLLYGLILGVVAMAGMWFLAMPQAALLGPLVASLVSTPLDRLQAAGPGRG